MDIQRNSIASRISSSNNPNQRNSLRSVMSLQRTSSHRNSSLTRRVSLVNAMDLQSSFHSSRAGQDDFITNIDSQRFSNFGRQSNKSKDQYSFHPAIQEKDLNRKSNYNIKHECRCSVEQCLDTHCICYLTPQQICVIGQCCPRCIAMKNEYLMQNRGFQLSKDKKQTQMKQQQNRLIELMKQKNCKNLHYFKQVHANQPCMKDLIFCTCKKSHCQKKYCLCFQKGVKCGQFCICIECQNKNEDNKQEEQQQRRWERYATYKPYDEKQNLNQDQIDPDIDQYLQQQQPGDFIQTMEFQPVNFDRIYATSYQ